jgi:hypothetical protein
MKIHLNTYFLKWLAILLVLMGAAVTRQDAQALTTCESTEDGDWSVITWSCGHTPFSSDDVIIKHTVSLDGPATVNDLTIFAGGGDTGVLTADSDLTVTGNWTLDMAASFFPAISTVTFAGSSGDQTIGGGGSQTFNDLVIANDGTSDSVIVNNFVEVNNDLMINTGGHLSFTGDILDVGNTLSNNGTLRITKAVDTATEHEFPSTASFDYKGIFITPPSGLGNVTVTIQHLEGGETCTTSMTVNYTGRCFTVSPALPSSTTVRLWAHTDEMNSIPEANLMPYQYKAPAWTALGSISTGNDSGDYHYAEGVTSTGGSTVFLLGGTAAPTAINLLSLSATSGAWNGQSAAFGLAVIILVTFGYVIWRRRQQRT